MKIALISNKKIQNYKDYVPAECTEILTNIQNLLESKASIPITYLSDIGELIEKSDYVIVLCRRGSRKMPSFISMCKKHRKSFEIILSDSVK